MDSYHEDMMCLQWYKSIDYTLIIHYLYMMSIVYLLIKSNQISADSTLNVYTIQLN